MDLEKCDRLFVYGILRRGYAADLSQMGAEFVSEATLKNSQLYWLGNRAGVGLRFEPTKIPAQGEIWQIPDDLWEYLDLIEGVRNGVYKRLKAFPVLNNGTALETYVYLHTFYNTSPEHYNDPIPSNSF